GRVLQSSCNTDIPADRLTVTYCRSSGPGGQNVNKVNTKAEVRFHVATADWLPEDVRSAITAKVSYSAEDRKMVRVVTK
ncbi:hypothetical protein scyTo_0023139, partial [Scyliorhinus torazame]|nr:hypothetical protein [Scyliorhinus torazame]